MLRGAGYVSSPCCGGGGEGSCRKAAAAPPLTPLSVSAPSGATWLRPSTLAQALQMRGTHGHAARMVGGNTGIGVEKYYNQNLQIDAGAVYIDISRLKELSAISTTEKSLLVGAAVPINELADHLDTAVAASRPTTAGFTELARHARLIANNQVRNVGTWAGNLMIAAKHPLFPSDLLTCFSCAGASLHLVRGDTSSSPGSTSTRVVTVIEFAQAAAAAAQPGQPPALRDDEIITALELPLSTSGNQVVFNSWKIMSRHQNAHAYINSAARLELSREKTVLSACFTFGGLGSGLRVCTKTAAYLVGKPLNSKALQGALALLTSESKAAPPPPHYPGVVASAAYREQLCAGLFYKFFVGAVADAGGAVPSRLKDLTVHAPRPISGGTSSFKANPSTAPLSMPVTKLEAYSQCTGEATYTDDIPERVGELNAAYVYSDVSCGVISRIDASAALAMAGVVDFLSAKDVTASGCTNECGAFPGDEEIFASTHVYCAGQAIGLVVADTLAHAQAAALRVKAVYNSLPAKPLLSIDDAIAANSFITENQYDKGHVTELACGDVTKGFAAAKHTVQGVVRTGAQEHFYMETQASVCIPEEDGFYTVYSSCQGPASMRMTLGAVLQIPGCELSLSCLAARLPAQHHGNDFFARLAAAKPTLS
jgi:xanthine dehydrogenase/oxidase